MVLLQVGDLGGAGVHGHFIGGPLQGLAREDPEGVGQTVEAQNAGPQQEDRGQKHGQPLFG